MLTCVHLHPTSAPFDEVNEAAMFRYETRKKALSQMVNKDNKNNPFSSLTSIISDIKYSSAIHCSCWCVRERERARETERERDFG